MSHGTANVQQKLAGVPWQFVAEYGLTATAFALSALGWGAKKVAQGVSWGISKLVGSGERPVRSILKKSGAYEERQVWGWAGLRRKKVVFREVDMQKDRRYFRKDAPPKCLGKFKTEAELRAEEAARDKVAEKEMRDASFVSWRRGFGVTPCRPIYS